MWNKQLCLGLIPNYGISYEKQLELLKSTGFDGFFVVWDENLNFENLVNVSTNLGLHFQSIHAPWNKAADMWKDNKEKGQIAIDELKSCVDTCVKCKVNLLVAHAFVGFTEHNPTEIGLQRFATVINYAKSKKIKIAFENTEGEEYLYALMHHFEKEESVGFCWDSGHEMCYNHSQDLLKLYGNKLICTHLNDNLGISDFNGETTWLDDLHLLPFDGIANWQNIAERLYNLHFTDILTFELSVASKPGRHDNDMYGQIPFEQYLAMAYQRACRFATMLINLEKVNVWNC